jgi:hypothetical protein
VYLWSKWLTCCHNTGIRISLIQQPEPSGSEAGEAGEKQVRKFEPKTFRDLKRKFFLELDGNNKSL